ncbi:MAG: NAD-dependent epimerase/dehydratase family protein [Solirubrobacteraceae bacterium]
MILLTGASGFIGKHLLSLLIEKFGKENIVALTSKPIKDCAYLLHNNYQFDGDFFIKNGYEKIETIIHAGAYTPKKGSEANDINLCNSNIYNTEKLLNTILPNLKKVIYLSTLDVYANDLLTTETTLEKPVSLYGHSKLYCEKMIESWGKEQNKVVQILRIGHVYGPGEEAYQKIIPITINKILQNQSIQIWGNGNELRTFIYIKDVVKAITKAISIDENIGVVNLVGGHSISINNLVNKILFLSKKEVIIEKVEAKTEGRNLIFDNSKMISHLVSHETLLDDGLLEEFEYMKNYNTNLK